jgi:hypothetical protein
LKKNITKTFSSLTKATETPEMRVTVIFFLTLKSVNFKI